VVCAVSGGADSLALLVLAVAAGCRVTAAHVDHALRPGSAAEADAVAAVAERCGADFLALRAEVAAGPNLEARAREARFAVLPPDVLTGHTADDQAETVLVNLCWGAGLDGLAGMRPDRHPLLALRRHETAALCRAEGLTPLDDPTNADPAFRRNRLRHEALPLLADIAQRDVAEVVARQAALLRADADLLDALAAGIDPTDARALATAPVALARRAVRRWLSATARAGGHPPDAAAVERVLAVARGEVLATEVAGAGRVSRSRGRLSLDASYRHADG
jgi:tRNA(Ile)-lysidine synthase